MCSLHPTVPPPPPRAWLYARCTAAVWHQPVHTFFRPALAAGCPRSLSSAAALLHESQAGAPSTSHLLPVWQNLALRQTAQLNHIGSVSRQHAPCPTWSSSILSPSSSNVTGLGSSEPAGIPAVMLTVWILICTIKHSFVMECSYSESKLAWEEQLCLCAGYRAPKCRNTCVHRGFKAAAPCKPSQRDSLSCAIEDRLLNAAEEQAPPAACSESG